MAKNKMALGLRKWHRWMSLPMTALVVANVSTRPLEVHPYIENVTAASMVLMTITGFTLFLLTMKLQRNDRRKHS